MARLGDSQRLKQITRAVGATTVVGAASARRATAVQVSEHALLVHSFSGVVAVHVDAFDALLADALAHFIAGRRAGLAFTTDSRSLTRSTR